MLAAQTLAPAFPVFPLAALPSNPATTSTTAFHLAANPHQGVRSSVATWQLGLLPGNVHKALGMPVCLYDSGRRSRDSGKERDSETNLDFFESRYYSGAQGRFTSPDEFKGGIVDPFTGQDIETNTALPYADITNPQTLNKYAYVMNNPLRYTDPTGHCPMCVVEVLESPVVQEAIEKATPFIGAALGAAAGWALSQSQDVGRAILGGPVMTPAAPYTGSVAADLVSLQTRGQALSDAKKDARVPTSQQPEKQASVPATDQNGKPVVVNGEPQSTREYTHTTGSGEKVVVQDHPGGHNFPDGGKVGPHVNVRPQADTRHGKVPGTKPHYPYKKPGEN